MTATVCAVVVTHRRPEELATSLKVVTNQSRMIDHLIVIDNDNDASIRDLVAGQSVPTTYVGSHRNLGGAGGFTFLPFFSPRSRNPECAGSTFIASTSE